MNTTDRIMSLELQLARAKEERDGLRQKLQTGKELYEGVVERCQAADIQAAQAGMRLRQYQDKCAALEAHVERLHEGLHQSLIHWGPHCTEEDGIAYAECERRCDASPQTSLTKLIAQKQAEMLEKLKSKDLHTNNGDIRPDAEFRAGWNTCLAELRRQAEGQP